MTEDEQQTAQDSSAEEPLALDPMAEAPVSEEQLHACGDEESIADTVADHTVADDADAAGDSASEPSVDEPQLPPSQSLQEAAERVGIELPDSCWAGLEAYCAALWDWNTKINLTRHTDYDLFARRDLLDTVKLALHVEQEHEVLDIGTGGGVPGVVLAIIRPDLQISVCDGVAKKANVVHDIVRQLDLPVTVYASRAQPVLEDMRYHTLVTRAAGSICQLMTWVSDYWLSFDTLLAIKGPRWVEERKEARHRSLLNGIELRRVEGYKMPGTKSESVILQFRKNR